MGRRALLLLLSAWMTGCLVTGEKEFEFTRNVPPVVIDKSGTEFPIGSIVWVDPDTVTTLSWQVDVRDENVDETLVARWRVVTEGDALPPFKSSTLPGVKELTRELEVTIDQGDLEVDTCHRLDLVVSGSFFRRESPALFDEPETIGDLGRATWWLWAGRGEALTSDDKKLSVINSCPTKTLEAVLTSEDP